MLDPLVKSVIRPTLAKSGLTWKGLYAGRRGAVTEIINRSGNVALGQGLARHKNMGTTLTFYKKQISAPGLREGMKLLERAMEPEGSAE